MLVMPAVGRHPPSEGALNGHASGDSQAPYSQGGGLKRAVGKKPMEAYGDSETGDQIEKTKNNQIHRAKPSLPAKDHGHEDTKWGKTHN
jgi:hypothetical protein